MPFSEGFSLFLGVLIFLVVLPPTVCVVAMTVLWDGIDRGFLGQPQDGVVMSTVRFINRVTQPLFKYFVRYPDDAFLVNCVVAWGVCLPALFWYLLKYTIAEGFSFTICMAYHILRLGPYFMSFAYVYTLCHKEGHSRLGLFARPISPVMKFVFNWWIGLLYGVMPSSFACGHSINHHKYNNGPLDVVSTADRPRDSFINWVKYLPRWTLYSLNISTTRQFIFEGEYMVAFKMIAGSCYYWAFFYFFYRINPTFAIGYVLFPLGENILLLACVNWCWHAFLDPEHPDDTYVGSVTLFDGPINVLNEDLHVVHHQYPGAHWTTHPQKYKQHVDRHNEYAEHTATAFAKTHAFELFFLIILGQHKEMAKRFVDLSGLYPKLADKEALIKLRLQTCWWGPKAKINYNQKGWEGVQDDDGHRDQSN